VGRWGRRFRDAIKNAFTLIKASRALSAAAPYFPANITAIDAT
jgi:hypothetical protein